MLEGMKDLSHSDNVSAVEGNSRLTNMGFVPVGSAVDKQVCSYIIQDSLLMPLINIYHYIHFRQKELR